MLEVQSSHMVKEDDDRQKNDKPMDNTIEHHKEEVTIVGDD